MNEPDVPATQSLKPLAVLRDIGIVWGLTLLCGFVVGVAGAKSNLTTALVLCNFLFGIVGFVIAGCLTIENRWKHLFAVSVGLWLVGLVNMLFIPMTLLQWFQSYVFILIIMGIGGGLAAIVRKRSPPAHS